MLCCLPDHLSPLSHSNRYIVVLKLRTLKHHSIAHSSVILTMNVVKKFTSGIVASEPYKRGVARPEGSYVIQ